MIVSFLIGLILGIIYFGGLYYSTKKFTKVKRPALFMVLSFIIRMGILVVGFYYLTKTDYKNVLIALVGVILTRFIIIFKVKDPKSNSVPGEE